LWGRTDQGAHLKASVTVTITTATRTTTKANVVVIVVIVVHALLLPTVLLDMSLLLFRDHADVGIIGIHISVVVTVVISSSVVIIVPPVGTVVVDVVPPAILRLRTVESAARGSVRAAVYPVAPAVVAQPTLNEALVSVLLALGHRVSRAVVVVQAAEVAVPAHPAEDRKTRLEQVRAFADTSKGVLCSSRCDGPNLRLLQSARADLVHTRERWRQIHVNGLYTSRDPVLERSSITTALRLHIRRAATGPRASP